MRRPNRSPARVAATMQRNADAKERAGLAVARLRGVPPSTHPDDVAMTIERDGVDVEVEAFVQEGYVAHAFVACERPKREVTLTPDEERRAVDAWLDRRALKKDAHDADAYDRAGDR